MALKLDLRHQNMVDAFTVHKAQEEYKSTLSKFHDFVDKKQQNREVKEIRRKMRKIEKLPKYNHHPFGYELGDDADYPSPFELPEYRALDKRYYQLVYKNAPEVEAPIFQLKNGEMVRIKESKLDRIISKWKK